MYNNRGVHTTGFYGWLCVIFTNEGEYMVSRLGFWVRVAFGGSISNNSGGIQKILLFRGSFMLGRTYQAQYLNESSLGYSL